MKHIFAYLLLVFIWSSACYGASFICSKATTEIEKMICANDTLSRLDVTLSNSYEKALAASKNPTSVRAAQRSWLRTQRNVCEDVPCLEAVYKKRINELQASYASVNDRFLDAAMLGEVEEMRRLVSLGADVNYINTHKLSPLMTATNWNQYDAVRELMKLGANVRYHRDGESALFIATGRDTRIVKALIDAGADVNLPTEKFKYTPLGRAAGNTERTFQTLKSMGSYGGPFPDRLETVRLLLKSGANVNHIDGFEESLLRTAMRVGNFDIARLLLEAGADVHQRRDDSTSRGRQEGNTILMTTIAYHSVYKDANAIRLLLEYGANSNDKNDLEYDAECDATTSGKCTWNGHTVLTFAASRGYDKIVSLLLKHGANPAIPRQDGKTAIELAREGKHDAVVRILEQHARNGHFRPN